MRTESPFIALAGAVPDEHYGVPAHYGNPIAEQRRLLSGGAVVDLSHRGVIAVTGPDRLSWLDSMVSQDVASLLPGQSIEALLLDATGRVEHQLRLVDDGTTTWIIVDAEHADALRTWLDRMRFMLRVEVSDRGDDYAVVGWASPAGPREAVDAVATWVDPWSAVHQGGVQYSSASAHPASEWTWSEAIVTHNELAGIAYRVSVGAETAAGLLAADALRIAAWRPQLPDEGDDVLLPHEVDWLRSAVHLSKGCYRGQETVAKVHNLGHPPRRLVFLNLDGSESALPRKGDTVRDASDAEVGVITSAAVHHELGPIALALVRRSTSADADLVAVTTEGVRIAAAQEVVVPADAGAAVSVPRLPRLGAKRR